MKKQKWISLVAAAVLAAGILSSCGAASSASQEASSTAVSSAASVASSAVASSAASEAAGSGASAAAIQVAFTVTDQDGNAKDYTLDATAGETLSDALQAAGLISADEAAAGFATTVDGMATDYNKDKSWWMLVDKDGNMTSVGIGDIQLAEGDSYGFTYTVG
ncbi:MAG: DUF4430 domain-containing protein [Faecalibacterium sp.]|jgi:maltose-binding protein MalE|nr:DUF4430 domain-containing protein [Faecalibacterium sp.]